MDYKLFTEYITLQALLKEIGVIQSGGAIKSFLSETTVLFNDEDEKRRGKKIRIGDVVSIPSLDLTIDIVEPTTSEKIQYDEDLKEKIRVSQLVKKLNQTQKKNTAQNLKSSTPKNLAKKNTNSRKPVRFPGI